MSPCDAGVRPRLWAGLLAGSMLVSVCSGGGADARAADWEVRPQLSVAVGGESDLTLVPDPTPLEVSGGAFLNLSPGLLAFTDLGPGARLSLWGRGTWERFDNEAGRTLLAGNLGAELRRRLGRSGRLRLTLAGHAFDDSERLSVRRLGGGAELGLALVRPRWLVEARAGAEGRHYPELWTRDDRGALVTYGEGSLSLGLAARAYPSRRLAVGVAGTRTGTDARDPLFDATAWLLEADGTLRLGGSTWLELSGLFQERDFDAREPGLDVDRYWQAGAALRQGLGRGTGLTARFAAATYERTDGDEVETTRFSLAFTWRPGGSGGSRLAAGVPTASATGALAAPVAEPPVAGEPVRFRLEAPDARAVSLVGDWNGWDPAAAPLAPAGGGWWEIRLALPAGVHEYAYWVDGVVVTPPEATRLVDDGFGGRNGVIEILPPDR